MDEKAPASPTPDAKPDGTTPAGASTAPPTNTEAVPVDGAARPAAAAAPPAAEPAPRRGLFGGGPADMSPDAQKRRTLLRLKVLGAMLALLGAMFVYQFGAFAFTASKDETWNGHNPYTLHVELVNADNGTLRLDYGDRFPAASYLLASNISVPVDVASQHVTFHLDAGGKSWSKEAYIMPRSGAMPLELDAMSADPLPTTSPPSAYRVVYAYAGAALLVLLGGIACFLRILRPLAMTGSLLLVLAAPFIGAGDMLMTILLAAAGIFTFLTLRRSKEYFAQGLDLKTPVA